jgi:CheY-like chemotaxis protein
MGTPEDATLEEEERVTARQSGGEEKAARDARVLVAEDNPVNQKVAVRMLERLGYRADVVADGLEAVEALTRIPYAAVLMDVQMPKMDGYEATAEIRRREQVSGGNTPIIAMTANAMESDREQAFEAGMDDFVSKQVKPGELEAVLGRWIVEEETASTTAPAAADGSGAPKEFDDPIDRATIESLRELGGSEMLSELTEMFFEDARSGISAIRDAVERGDAQTVERAAHTLKGSSGNMGAQRMSALCGELQDAGVSGYLTHAPELLQGLEVEFGRVRPALEAEVARG